MDSFFRTSSPAFVVCFPDCHSSWNSHFTFEYHLACILFWLKMLNISSSIGHFNFVWDPFNSFAHLLIELLILLVFNFFELCLYSGYESFVCRIAGKDFISFCRVSLHFVIVFFFLLCRNDDLVQFHWSIFDLIFCELEFYSESAHLFLYL
jgi:hypothetical protein